MKSLYVVFLLFSFPVLSSSQTAQPNKINVCISIKFLTTDKNNETPQAPPPITLTVDKGSTAHDILKEARNKDPVSYSFKTKSYSFGNMLTAIGGVEQDPKNNKFWMKYTDEFHPNGNLTSTGIDHFKPKHGTCVIFKYEKLGV